MKLYGFWRSLATFRVRIALRLKQVAFEEISVNLMAGEQFDTGYDALNPEHVVPTLVDGETRLFQSMAILEYLEETHPERPLLPREPRERAYARGLALVTIADSHPLIVPRVRHHLAAAASLDEAGVNSWGAHFMREGLKTYETLLERRPPAPFALGSEVGIADIGIVSHCVGARYFGVEVTEFARVAALARAAMELPDFAEAHPLKQPGAPQAGGAHG